MVIAEINTFVLFIYDSCYGQATSACAFIIHRTDNHAGDEVSMTVE
jgi:hypothetical protein